MKDLQSNYASFLVDSHITDHDPLFLSRLGPQTFVDTVKRSGCDSFMTYATCHNGNSYYPTKLGHMHPGLKGRDVFGETVALLRKNDIVPRAYYTVVYMRRVAREHPAWRVTQIDGKQNYRRSWHLCPNSLDYRSFACAQIREICRYDIDSIFIDMTFWPGVCFCHNCRDRYRRETGDEIPTTIDWNDRHWVGFQRSRERWLAEFAHELTTAVKSTNSKIAVAHQFSPVLLGWMYAQTHAHSLASDLPSGDFYGGKHQQRLGCKVLASFERQLPFEFMTSRCVTLYDHTSTKSDDEMICSCATTLANGGTYLLIDAINPDGTLEEAFYDRMEKIGTILAPFASKLGKHRPKLVADTAIYFSMASYIRRDHNGVSLRNVMDPANNMLASTDLKPLQEALGTSIVLNQAKIPYRVINDATVDFAGLDTIILNDASFLSAAEVSRLREFVRSGGTLIATGMVGYSELDGSTTGDFALADVLGIKFSGQFSRHWSYLVPHSGPMVSNDVPAPLVTATTATVLARVSEPLWDKDDFEHFAAYHSNPPGPVGPYAGLTVNKFGDGRAVYLYSSLFARQHAAQQAFGQSLFRDFASSRHVIECNAPSAVEVTLLKSTTRPTYLLSLVNFQDELPNIPVHNVQVKIRFPEVQAGKCSRVSDGCEIEPHREGDRLSFSLARLDMLEMIEIQVKGVPA